MSQELWLSMGAAVSIGFIHTVAGPDHYLPFVMMAQARGWTLRRTAVITFLCGLGHVLSSVILGMVGIALGIAVGHLEIIEGVRGDLAAWALIAFGLVYFVWGVRRAIRNRPHTHAHLHNEGPAHIHEHVHTEDHAHTHEEPAKKSITPWVLFTIFVLGPCEPLIPILMYPAAKESTTGMVLIAGLFSVATIGTMLTIVAASMLGFNLIPMKRIERYTHALAGGTILACGLAIQFLGL